MGRSGRGARGGGSPSVLQSPRIRGCRPASQPTLLSGFASGHFEEEGGGLAALPSLPPEHVRPPSPQGRERNPGLHPGASRRRSSAHLVRELGSGAQIFRASRGSISRRPVARPPFVLRRPCEAFCGTLPHNSGPTHPKHPNHPGNNTSSGACLSKLFNNKSASAAAAKASNLSEEAWRRCSLEHSVAAPW